MMLLTYGLRDDRRISPVLADLPGPFTYHPFCAAGPMLGGHGRGRPNNPWSIFPRAFALGRLAVGPDVPSSSARGQ